MTTENTHIQVALQKATGKKFKNLSEFLRDGIPPRAVERAAK